LLGRHGTEKKMKKVTLHHNNALLMKHKGEKSLAATK
jgi:hypothetical protein